MELLKWKILPFLALIASEVILYTRTSVKTHGSGCTLLPHDRYWIQSSRIVTPGGVISGAVEVNQGIITSVIDDMKGNGYLLEGHVIDYKEAVVMPGLVDVHAHLDEPGRTEWEGFLTGTKAAVAGGVTTLIDMPLNNFPATISEETLRLKVEATQKKLYVDVGFWGGLVPENAFNNRVLDNLLQAGVLGLKSFMCPSGIDDFPMTNATHIKEGIHVLAKYKRPLLVHAEIQQESAGSNVLSNGISDPRLYSTYLKTRPASWEQAAIKELREIAEDTKVGGQAEGAHVHIVHLSDAGASLDLIKDAKSRGASLSVETCPHYLAFSAEEIPFGDTRFKCAPPIREAANREKLWKSLMDGDIDFLSSDHSPCEPHLKLLEEGDFLRAWGGISSLQFVLPITWSHGQKYGIAFDQIARWWSERPAKFAGLHLKGGIREGNHADLVVWEPETEFTLDENLELYQRHPNISAYMGTKLKGRVLSTFVRGNLVYNASNHAPEACGTPILAQ